MGHATNPGPWRCIEPYPGDGHLPGKRRGLIGKFTSATLEKTRLNPGPRMCDNEKCIYSPNRRRRLIFVLQVRWASAAPDAGRGPRDREICRPALRDFQYFPIHTPPSRRRFFLALPDPGAGTCPGCVPRRHGGLSEPANNAAGTSPNGGRASVPCLLRRDEVLSASPLVPVSTPPVRRRQPCPATCDPLRSVEP